MLYFVLILLLAALVLVFPAQVKMIKESSVKSQKTISMVALFCLGFGIGIHGYIITSGISL